MIEDGIKISELGSATSFNNEDLIPIVQNDETKNIAMGDFLGTIVESGSNTNGNYIKYGDGTMICTKKVTGTTDINETWGSGTTSGASTSIAFGSWPKTFIATPVVNVTVQRSGSNSWVTGVDSISTTNAGAVSLCRFTGGLNVPYTLHVIGIGKWK